MGFRSYTRKLGGISNLDAGLVQRSQLDAHYGLRMTDSQTITVQVLVWSLHFLWRGECGLSRMEMPGVQLIVDFQNSVANNSLKNKSDPSIQAEQASCLNVIQNCVGMTGTPPSVQQEG